MSDEALISPTTDDLFDYAIDCIRKMKFKRSQTLGMKKDAAKK